MSNQEDDLAYGEYDRSRGPNTQDGDRGLVGDTFRYFKGRYKQSQQSQQPYGEQFDPSQPHSTGRPPSGQQQYGSSNQGYGSNQSQYMQGSYVSYPQFLALLFLS